MSGTTESAETSKRKITGDWRGLPAFLTVLAIVGAVLMLPAIAMMYDGVGASDATVTAAFGSGLFSCLLLYCVAAVIAALRGLLARNTQSGSELPPQQVDVAQPPSDTNPWQSPLRPGRGAE